MHLRNRRRVTKAAYVVIICTQLFVVSYLQARKEVRGDAKEDGRLDRRSIQAMVAPPLDFKNKTMASDELINGTKIKGEWLHNGRRNKIKTSFAQSLLISQVKTNTNRRQVLNAYCDKHPDYLAGPLGPGALQQILVSDRSKLMYCHVPQAGCNFWKGVMMVMDSDSRHETVFDSETSKENDDDYGLRTLGSYTYRERRHRIETYTKIIYVRHPFVRLHVAFKNRFDSSLLYNRRNKDVLALANLIRRKTAINRTEEELRPMEKDEPITWQGLVEFLLTGNGSLSTPLQAATTTLGLDFAQTNSLCDPCKIQYDYIGKQETLEIDSRFMLRELNADSLVAFPSRDKRQSANGSIASHLEAFEELPKDVVKKLWNVYGPDFGLFNYQTPNFVK